MLRLAPLSCARAFDRASNIACSECAEARAIDGLWKFFCVLFSIILRLRGTASRLFSQRVGETTALDLETKIK